MPEDFFSEFSDQLYFRTIPNGRFYIEELVVGEFPYKNITSDRWLF